MKKTYFYLFLLLVFLSGYTQSGRAETLTNLSTDFTLNSKLVGHWEFKSAAELFKATKGSDLTSLMTEDLIYHAVVDGISTVRIDFGGAVTSGMSVAHGIAANGGGTTTEVKNFAMMFDIKIDANKGGSTNENLSALYWNGNRTDGSIFVSFSDGASNRKNGVGLGTYKTDLLLPGDWNRIILNANLENDKYDIYVIHSDKTIRTNFDTSQGGVELRTDKNLVFCGDYNKDKEYGRYNVSQIAIFNDCLTATEIDSFIYSRLPKPSTDDNGPWYKIQVLGGDTDRMNRLFTAETDANSKERVNGRPLAEDDAALENQLWR
ncbi:hypothetical protein D0T49_11180, partial [Paludibacter sp. 221]|uniref:hypothetical protein n=1 Tax=Paludibacter sp. 221 TaxID=2302939 RepID=UPI0013D5E14C